MVVTFICDIDSSKRKPTGTEVPKGLGGLKLATAIENSFS